MIKSKSNLYVLTMLIFLLLLMTGCSEKTAQQKKHDYNITVIESSGINIPILTYTDANGDFYFRVLPDDHFLFENSQGLNGYPYEWTLVKNPNSQ